MLFWTCRVQVFVDKVFVLVSLLRAWMDYCTIGRRGQCCSQHCFRSSRMCSSLHYLKKEKKKRIQNWLLAIMVFPRKMGRTVTFLCPSSCYWRHEQVLTSLKAFRVVQSCFELNRVGGKIRTQLFLCPWPLYLKGKRGVRSAFLLSWSGMY